MKLALNLAFLLILLLCVWSGYRKGLIAGIGSLLAIVISLYGAHLLSTTYSYEVIDAFRPFVSGYTETVINRQVRSEFNISGSSTSSLSVEDYLAGHPEDGVAFCRSAYEHLGIYTDTAEAMARDTVSYAQTQESPVTDAIVAILCRRITYIIGFFLAFILILIVLTVLGNLPNLSFKIPNMDVLNDVGGLIAGLVQGVMFCMILGLALKFTGLLLPQETLSDSLLPSLFMRSELISGFLGL